MLRINLMPRSDDATLEQRKSRFNGIGVNVAVSILAGVVDCAVLVLLNLIERPRVDARFVGHNHFDTPRLRSRKSAEDEVRSAYKVGIAKLVLRDGPE